MRRAAASRRHYEAKDEQRIIAALDTPPPAGYARWNGTLLAKHLGDISKHQIWCVLRSVQPASPPNLSNGGALEHAQARARDFAGAAAQLVHQHRSGVRAKGRRHRSWVLREDDLLGPLEGVGVLIGDRPRSAGASRCARAGPGTDG
jgi:hypothetical protein